VRLEVTSLIVRSFDLDHLDLFWEIGSLSSSRERETHEIFDYDFYVLRSQDSPLGEYKEIAGPMRDQYRLRDIEVSLLHKWRQYFYKIKVVHRPTGETIVTEPQSHAAERDLTAAEIMRLEDKLFREFIGRQCILFPIRTFGPRCTCYDKTLQRTTLSNHLLCYGTGWLGGYHQPILCYIQIDPVAQSRTESPLQEQQTRVTQARMIAYPPVSPDDVIVEAENKRWKVVSMTPTERLRGKVHQELVIHELPRGDVEYALPVNLDAQLFKPAATRNFTNPHNLEAAREDISDMLNFFGVPRGHVR
jgi:hypothetical protein